MLKITERPAIQRDADPQKKLAELQIHLHESFRHLEGINRCAVLFSGGVDSSLAALLAKQHCKDVLLITARCENTHDAIISKKSAHALSLDLVEVRIDSENLWKTLHCIMQVIKKTDRMNVEIAIPFFFASQEARKQGYEIMISGQGPDELFGGYARYESMFIDKGPEAVEKALWRDYSVTDEANIQRDSQVIEYHQLRPFFPYLHPKFVSCALTIPAVMNIDPQQTPARKLMFRKLAVMMGIPEEIAILQKRATQYSSGTSKMLIQAIKEHVEGYRNESKRAIQLNMDEILEKISHQQFSEE